MRLPQQQPQRALVAALMYLVVGGAGALALVVLRGPFLGGVIALLWLGALTVPLAVRTPDEEPRACMLRPRRMRLLLPLLVALACTACGADEQVRESLAAAPAPTSSDGTVPAPGPATVETAPGQQVALYHCGVQTLTYDGRSWEVEDPPFDGTNAPDSFSGFGTFERVGDVLTFTDREGAQLRFTPDDGTPDPYVCA